jgi:dipeptidyl aminopeptidase/acylaminoacyl peptidase
MRRIVLALLFASSIPALALAAGEPVPAVAPVPIPSALVADGLPPVSRALAAEVARYTEFRSASFVAWHPVDHQMLIATRFGNTQQIHRVKSPGGDRTQLTFATEPVTNATYEPVAGRYLLFQKDQGGDEFTQLYRQDLADGRITLLTDGGRSQNANVKWSHTGDRIAYDSTRRNGADSDLYVMDPLHPESDRRVLSVEGGGWSVTDWSPDDRRLLVVEQVSINETRLWSVDANDGTKTRVSPDGTEPTVWRSALFHPDGKRAYVLTDRDAEVAYLALLDLATGKVQRVSGPRSWDVERFELSRDGRILAFTVNDEGLSKLFLIDTATGAEREVGAVPVGVIGRIAFHPDGKLLAISVGSSAAPSDVYTLDLSHGDVARWTESETGGMVLALPNPEVVRWKSFDGREISGFLYRPAPRFAGPRPVLVNIHGGPEGQARPNFMSRWSYLLDQLGVALLEPNVRGSTGYGKTFVKLDNGMARDGAIQDIGALLDWIGHQPGLDASRVMVYGGSYGGFMSLASATHFSDRLRGAIDVVGISNLGTFLDHTEDYRRDLRRVEYGDERDPAMRAYFDRTAPLSNAGKITKPLFVIQGANDPRVPRGEAEQIVAATRKNGVPVWYLLGTNEGHGFNKKENQDYQFFAMIEFLRRYLLPEPGAATAAAR